MKWLYLFLAILLEASGTVCMKLSHGMTLLRPSISSIFLYICCLSILPLALTEIELTIAYSIWAGLGALLVAVVGILYFHESTNLVKLVGVGLIVLGTVGLKACSTIPEEDKD